MSTVHRMNSNFTEDRHTRDKKLPKSHLSACILRVATIKVRIIFVWKIQTNQIFGSSEVHVLILLPSLIIVTLLGQLIPSKYMTFHCQQEPPARYKNSLLVWQHFDTQSWLLSYSDATLTTVVSKCEILSNHVDSSCKNHDVTNAQLSLIV